MKTNEIPCLYRDDSWLVVHKPTGISTHAANSGDLGLTEWLELHHGLKLHVCSRLDKGTSGVLILAVSAAASGRAQKIHAENLSRKTYYFISDKKHAGESKWICKEPLDEAACATTFELIESGHGYFLYSAEITRGKKHQIRRHAFASGISVLGDVDYQGTEFSRLCLHCGDLKWPEIDKDLSVELPRSFQGLLEGAEDITIQTEVTIERRLDWLASITNAFRAVHRGEIMSLPFAIDVFDRWMCVTGYDEDKSSQELKDQIQAVLDKLSEQYAIKGGVIKTNRQDPHKRKLFSDLLSWGESIPESFLVQEQGCSYEVMLNDTQHIGLFLDQRDTRRRVGLMSSGKRVANLFSFTCSFSVVAAKENAEIVFSIDLAAGSLDRGKRNFASNELDKLNRGKFIKEDVRNWLARQLKNKQASPKTFKSWDVIICDPPVFASSGKGQVFSVAKMWSDLAKDIREILSENGTAFFSNNHQKGSDHFYLNELKKHFPNVTQLRPPFDFPKLKGASSGVRIFKTSFSS
jgi:23S rRNA G2069 N7-methylase RlmK/C1962 C5-methylase RlmI